MKHGDIYWARLPDRGGHEQRGHRPVVIWQDTEAYKNLPTIIVIPLTTRQDATRFGGSVLIHPSDLNGLKATSVALVFQLGACDVRRLGDHVGTLDEADLARLRQAASKIQKLT